MERGGTEGAAAGEGRQDEAVGEGEGPERQGLEQGLGLPHRPRPSPTHNSPPPFLPQSADLAAVPGKGETRADAERAAASVATPPPGAAPRFYQRARAPRPPYIPKYICERLSRPC